MGESIKLPEFESPPAVETLMGFYFARFAEWSPLHFGKFWAALQDDYPSGQMAPTILSQRDVSSGSPMVDGQGRAMFTDLHRAELLQVQASLFIRNWRKTPENKGYTHYGDLKPKFEKDWNKFLAFLAENNMSRPEVFQCEVTYVNHLVRGKLWNSYSDLATLIKPIAPRTTVVEDGRSYGFLPEANSVSLNVGYYLAAMDVALQIVAQSAVQMDGSEVIELTVTAKAQPQGNSDEALFGKLDTCHEAVILGFEDVTTKNAHQIWGKR